MGCGLHEHRAAGTATHAAVRLTVAIPIVAILIVGSILLPGAPPASAADLLARGLEGWVVEGAGTKQENGQKVPVWTFADGVLHCRGGGYGFLRNETAVDDFRLELEYRFPKKGNSGIGIRTPPFTGVGDTRPSAAAWEVQLLTDSGKAPVRDSCCALYGQVAPREVTSRPAGEWNAVVIECRGPRIVVRHNDTVVIDHDQTSRPETAGKPLRGFVSLQNHGSEVEFRGIRLEAIEPAPRSAGPRPNVVVILADDLGYGDVHCFNPDRGRIPTPHIDSLAAEGMRFTDGHSSSGVCSPSRYALLTGRYHWRTRLQSGIVGVFGPPLIAADRVTIATLAHDQGYRTACIGKWHLGWDWPVSPQERSLLSPPRPEAGGTKGERRAAAAEAVATEGQVAAWREIFARPVPGGPTARGFDRYFGTDVPNWPPYCFIENDRTQGIPSEFLPARLLRDHQASTPGPALAGWALEPILPALAARACDFIATAARDQKPFLLYLPLTSPHTPLAVAPEWRGRSGLGRYGDFVMETDAAIGRVLDAIRTAGVADDTLVLLTSDNGCAAAIGAKELEALGHHPSGPLRGYKASAWEGGHRVPFIVRWPGVVAPGRVCDALVHQADLLRTLAEMWNASLPDDAGEDSVSLLPLLRGTAERGRDSAVSTSAAGVPAVRSGSWKYIAEPAAGDPAPVQLYDLAADLGESKNLAAAMPEKVAELATLLERLITAGSSTPGARQSNDVEVVRHPRAAAPAAKPRAKAAG